MLLKARLRSSVPFQLERYALRYDAIPARSVCEIPLDRPRIRRGYVGISCVVLMKTKSPASISFVPRQIMDGVRSLGRGGDHNFNSLNVLEEYW
jgi:hypothetical protein